MASDQAQLEKYEELIRALLKFNEDILQHTENMEKCGRVCIATMGSDQLSANSIAKLTVAVKKYREVTLKATDLAKKLACEREEIMKLIRESREED